MGVFKEIMQKISGYGRSFHENPAGVTSEQGGDQGFLCRREFGLKFRQRDDMR